jgi:hypothetical protein
VLLQSVNFQTQQHRTTKTTEGKCQTQRQNVPQDCFHATDMFIFAASACWAYCTS